MKHILNKLWKRSQMRNNILLQELHIEHSPVYGVEPMKFNVVDEFVNYGHEESLQFDFLDNSEESGPSSFFPKTEYNFSLDVSSLDRVGQYLKNGMVEVLSYLIKDKILLATILSCSTLLVFFAFLLPESANIAVSLFISAPLSMAIMGYYKKHKSKLAYYGI